MQDGRINIEVLNGHFCSATRVTPAEYSAGLKDAIDHGWLTMHESGTFVRLSQAGTDLFA